MASKLYYDPTKPSAFATWKLQAPSKKPPADIKAWLQKQDAHTQHRKISKRFPRNPYSVNIINDLWECDLVDVRSLTTVSNIY
jgi:hypothetical protein